MQLNFRKNILQQSVPPNCDKSVYNFTVKEDTGKRRNLTEQELTGNLLVLIKAAIEMANENPRRDVYDPLTGKNIKHKLDDGIWYSGKVIFQVPGYPAWYNVVYDNDDSVYSYQLRTDLEAGDLTIL